MRLTLFVLVIAAILAAPRAHAAPRPTVTMDRRSVVIDGKRVLIPGGAVHNFFVRQTLDVLHLDEGGRVTHVVAGLKPWRLGPLRVGGAATVELPPGTAERSGTRAGDVIDIRRHA